MEYKFYNKLPAKERKKLRAVMLEQRQNYLKVMALLDRTIISAMEERVELVDKFLKGEIHLQYYVKRQKYLSEYITKVIQ
jgi:hypothetical protein